MTEEEKTKKSRAVARAVKWNKDNPKRFKSATLKYAYGIDLDQFNALAELQEYKCAICDKVRPLCVDHCHSSGTVRGLLCRQCNSALGFLEEDLLVFKRAVEYLERNNL